LRPTRLKNLDILVQPDVVSCAICLIPRPRQTNCSERRRHTGSCGMAHVLARFRNTDEATHLINRYGDALDEGVAARRAVHKEADGAVNGSVLGGVGGHHHHLAEGDGGAATHLQWRMKWPVPGQEHRVAVKPGTSVDTLCDPQYTGTDVCKEV